MELSLEELLNADGKVVTIDGCKTPDEAMHALTVRAAIIAGVFERSVKAATALALAHMFTFTFGDNTEKAVVSFVWPHDMDACYRYAKRKTSATIIHQVVDRRKPEGLDVALRLILLAGA